MWTRRVGVASAMLMLRSPGSARAADASASRATLERGRYMHDVGTATIVTRRTSRRATARFPKRTDSWAMACSASADRGGPPDAPNLRLALSKMTEGDWVRDAKVLNPSADARGFIWNRGRTPPCARSIVRQEPGSGRKPGARVPAPRRPPPPPVLQWPAPPK